MVESNFWISLGLLATSALIFVPVAIFITKLINSGLASTPSFSAEKDLWTASWYGDVEAIRMRFQEGADLNSLDMHGKSPLHWAIEKGHDSAVEFLLTQGADCNKRDKNGETPLSMAAMNSSKKLTELLLSFGANMEIAAAALLGDYNYFEEYLNQGGSLHLGDKPDMSLLHLVSSRGDHPSLIELILAHGAEINIEDGWGCTPLAYAAVFGHQNIAVLLIKNGAKIDAKTKDFQTPLHQAANSGHINTVEILLEHGADVNADSNGGTSLCIASEKGHLSVVELLIQYNADVNNGGRSGFTPLHRATQKDQVSVAKLLIHQGANINARYGIFGYTPLFFATSSSMVELLKEYGAEARMYGWAKAMDG